MNRLLRRRELEGCIGLKRSAIYKGIADGLLPRPLHIGLRAVAWPESEISAINRARIAGLDDAAIRQLVTALHTARTAQAGL